MLHVENLQKSFDGFMAVCDARLDVSKGDIVAVIGPNGAGKTTLFNLITGQLRPDRGRVLFKGEDITGLAPYRICERGICRSFQIVNVFPRLSVFENVQVAVLAHQKRALDLMKPARNQGKSETERILAGFGLLEHKDRKAGTLSHGDQKVLEMAIALGNEPDLLILDEPTAGMSPEETAHCLTLMKRLSAETGVTILFCEHDMELVFAVSTSIMVMQQGTTIIQDRPHVVRASREVQEAYLGECPNAA